MADDALNSKNEKPLIELAGVEIARRRNVPEGWSRSIDWQLKRGEFWAVGGLNSAGKTQFLSIAAGLAPPPRGRHSLSGIDTGDMGERELLQLRLNVGIVFGHGARLFSHLTVAENVALPLRYQQGVDAPEIWQRVEALLEGLGLMEFAHNTPGVLRRDIQQRAGLARALALEPEALLLDNPVEGLDPRQRAWWRDTLEKLLRGEGSLSNRPVTVAMTSNNLRPWRDLANRVALMNDHLWLTVGGPDEVAASDEPLLRELLDVGQA